MAKKHKHHDDGGGHHGGHGWMTSFADLLTLLLCFFVLLLTMRAMDNQKFEQVMDGFGGAFGVTGKTMETGVSRAVIVPLGPPVPDTVTNDIDDVLTEHIDAAFSHRVPPAAATPPEPPAYKSLFETEISATELVTRIDAGVLFEEGTDRLLPHSREAIGNVATSLRAEPGDLEVTCYVPPGPALEPDEAWDLAARRAAVVAEVAVSEGPFDKRRLAAMGYGKAVPDAKRIDATHPALVLTLTFRRADPFDELPTRPPNAPPPRDPAGFDPLARPASAESAHPEPDDDDHEAPEAGHASRGGGALGAPH